MAGSRPANPDTWHLPKVARGSPTPQPLADQRANDAVDCQRELQRASLFEARQPAAESMRALAKLADGIRPQPIVIFSDINMPGMGGLTQLREIKKSWPEIPVMMVTAYGDDECPQLASDYGAVQFISKPVDFNLLKAQLRRVPSAPLERIDGATRP